MTGPVREFPSTKVAILAIAGVAAFLLYFFSLDLPNADRLGRPGEKIHRWEIWLYSIPGLVPNSTALPVDALSRLLDWQHLPQRFPIFGYATLIVIAAIGAGSLVLWTLGMLPRLVRRAEVELPKGTDHCLVFTAEWLVLAFGLGMSVLSLCTLGLGLAGWTNRAAFATLLGSFVCVVVVGLWRNQSQLRTGDRSASSARREAVSTAPIESLSNKVMWVGGVVAAGLFLTISLLGAALPATDFDVREYHLQGPKEFYLAGQIQILPHNVYTTMPFGTEMISLLGMIVSGDWWWGALVGQVVLASFAPITALGVWSLGRRLFGTAAGSIAALIYITTPWVYRISIIPYTENALCFFLLAGTLAVVLAMQCDDSRFAEKLWLIAGLMAGSAAACKYPALVSTVLPLGAAAIAWPIFSSHSPSPALPLSPSQTHSKPDRSAIQNLPYSVIPLTLGVLLACGPWLIKNAVTTGNPMYPLLFGVFGGRDWSPEKNAKWEWGHRVPLLVKLGMQRPPDDRSINPDDSQHAITARRLVANLIDVIAQADWQSPLIFGLAPLACFGPRSRRAAGWLWLFVGFLFFQWWLLTHRLDRFWVPLLPVAAVLAGAGAVWTSSRPWRLFLAASVALVVFFNFSYCTTGACGNNNYSGELVERIDPLPPDIPSAERPVNVMNRMLPSSARVLAVGAADLFHLDRRLVYNTVFDDSIFEQLAKGRESAEVAAALVERGITHLYFDWGEVGRYRGTYGFTEFVVPARIEALVKAGVLVRVPVLPTFAGSPVSIADHVVPARVLYEVKDAQRPSVK